MKRISGILNEYLLFLLIFIIPLKAAYFSEGEIHSAKTTRRSGSLIKVRPEFEERYVILHKHPFPEVLSQIQKVHICNYPIFLLDGILFSYYEYTGDNYESDMKEIANDATKEWWKLTDPMQEPLSTRGKDEWWAEMEQLLCLDKIVLPSSQATRIGLVSKVANRKENKLKAALKSFPKELEETVNKRNLQNSNFYFKDGKLYLYYEYVGNNMQQYLLMLSQDRTFDSFQDHINRFLLRENGRFWQTMNEVFHTN